MKKLFLTIMIGLFVLLIFSSCTIGDLYSNYQLKRRNKYIQNILPTLDATNAKIADELRKTLNPSYLGIAIDSVYFGSVGIDYVFELASIEEIKESVSAYLLLALIYDALQFVGYSDSPEIWFNKKLEVELNKIKEEKERIEQEKKQAEYLKSKYGEWYEYIEKGVIVIGMPKEVVKEILGPPDSINTTVTSFGVSEQWVYEKYDYTLKMGWPYLYLYFENGILKSWQRMD